MPKGAHVHFRDVLSGRWRVRTTQAQADAQWQGAGVAESLGPPETPPHGALRRTGWVLRLLWRRIVANTKAEWPLAKPRLWVIVPLLVFQYIHAIFTGMAYYMHEPLPEPNTTLHDLGFEALPYLSADWVSETLVYCAFGMFFVWALSPFVTRRKTFHFVVVLKRVLVVLVLCQVLRILTFLSTQLPAPAPHCRAPEPTSNVPWPVWWQVIIVNVGRQASKGCGDLIFSSHMTFVLTFAWTYAVMGQYLLLKAFWFCYAGATALCIIASRKHYTVDMTVAWYVVPLVFFHFCRKWTTTRDDVCTNDGRGCVALGPAQPAAAVPSHAGAGSPLQARPVGSDDGGDGGGGYGGAKPNGAGGPAPDAVASASDLEAGLGGGGSGGGEVRLSLELPPRRPSSAPLDGDNARQPPSPVKRALASAMGGLAALPRRIGAAAAGAAQPPAHRRTESMEPVLVAEDASASSLGP